MATNHEDPNAELGERLTEIIRAATTGAISEADARLLRYGCGLDAPVRTAPTMTNDETVPF